jgi:hypothetical protein
VTSLSLFVATAACGWLYISITADARGASSAVQCSAVQCSAVRCSAVQCSAVQCTATDVGKKAKTEVRKTILSSEHRQGKCFEIPPKSQINLCY